MVRLIASDMDGTLLDENAHLPEETFELVLKLKGQGIRFVAASGRRYDTLRAFFGPIADQIDYVASNGAQVYADGKLLSRDVFGCGALRRLKSVVGAFDNMHLVVHDATRCFLLENGAFYTPEIDKDLPNPVEIPDLPDPEIDLIKVCIYCDDNPMDCSYVLSRELGNDYVFAPSGHQWIDVMQRGVNKASGLQQVLDARGISANDAMVFGDSMNDYEMFRLAGQSIAMWNARYALRQVATRTIGRNADYAVQQELAKLLNAQ